MSDSDLQLLERYPRQHAEDAFSENVRRRLDLVFSTALRQVRSPRWSRDTSQEWNLRDGGRYFFGTLTGAAVGWAAEDSAP
jgi:hypothetical protein